MDFDVEIKGLKEVTETLKQLPDNIQKGAIRAGLRAGANVIKEEAKKRVRVKSLSPAEPKITVKQAYSEIAEKQTAAVHELERLEESLFNRAEAAGRYELSRKERAILNRRERELQPIFNLEEHLLNEEKWDPFLIRQWRKYKGG